MTYTQEFDVDSFPFWSGAKDTVSIVKRAGKMDSLQLIVEEAFVDSSTPPTKTQINDFVWLERDLILSQLGIDMED